MQREWLARWQENDDRAALEELVRREVSALRVRIRRAGLPASPASASDVAQEAVLRWLEADARFPSPAALRSYLWISARNLLVDRLRRSRRALLELSREDTRSLRLERSATGELGGVEDADLHAALELALNLLRPADQEILRLVYFEGHSIEQAALRLGIARDAANTRLVRSRVHLAEKLDHWREFVAG